MSTTNFYLLANQYGERYIHYRKSSEEKIIEDFSKIPFSAESLFEDICDGFQGFLCKNEQVKDFSTDYEYNNEGLLVGIYDPCFKLGEEKIFKMRLTQIVSVTISADAISADFYISKMNESEKSLFSELKNHLKNYCKSNNLSLQICTKESY